MCTRAWANQASDSGNQTATSPLILFTQRRIRRDTPYTRPSRRQTSKASSGHRASLPTSDRVTKKHERMWNHPSHHQDMMKGSEAQSGERLKIFFGYYILSTGGWADNPGEPYNTVYTLRGIIPIYPHTGHDIPRYGPFTAYLQYGFIDRIPIICTKQTHSGQF